MSNGKHHRGVSRTRRSLTASLSALALAAAMPAFAQEADAYPSRPVRLVIPTSPGGNHDLLARSLAEKLTSTWGKPVIVESKPGANTMLATTEVARSAPDGYTVLLTISGFVQNLLLQPNPPYKLADFAPVGMVALYPVAYAVGTGVTAHNLGQIVALARKQPGTLSFGSYGTGSSGHIIGAGLNQAAGISMFHVPYKGEAASFPDLVAGRLSSAYGSVGFYARQLRTGNVRLIAVASPHRLKNFPDVPTFAEAGYPDINLPGWAGMFVPAATPPDIVAKLSEAVREVVAMPDVQARIYEMGFEPMATSPTEFTSHLDSELEKWGKVVKENNIKLE